MCGRYTLRMNPLELAEVFGVEPQPELLPRFNIAPTQMNPVIRLSEGSRELSLMRWGFIPPWAKDEKIGYRMINARSEQIAKSYKPALKSKRCLVLADGWYEWREKKPFHFRMPDNQPFAFAGLWSAWRDIETFTIFTAQSDGIASEYHDRMPVILSPDAYDVWADPSIDGNDIIEEIVQGRQMDIEVVAANQCVGNVKNESPDCLN
ncbi:SOS response-associated peptidase [Thalassoglobus sp.]|uniref:SOS response-associated peptidase n=1 Tax=Thalassoglobus sp. TaxID=2795869 RepID=UPI003AA9CF50